jgi:hypothetical protein
VFQVEKQQEEELATEESQANFSAYSPSEHEGSITPYVLALILIAALAGAAIRLPPAGQRGRRPVAAPAEARHHDPYGRRRR